MAKGVLRLGITSANASLLYHLPASWEQVSVPLYEGIDLGHLVAVSEATLVVLGLFIMYNAYTGFRQSRQPRSPTAEEKPKPSQEPSNLDRIASSGPDTLEDAADRA